MLMREVFPSPITVLAGHAGTGKTNTALGLALALAHEGCRVTLADVDIVNPYFRSSDYPELLGSAGIRLIAPVLARTTLDTPSLTGELDAAVEQASPSNRIVIDVGGDDDGATALGRWSAKLRAADARMLYTVSAFRSITADPQEAAEMLPGIEAHCHLEASGILNASNLGDETTLEHVRAGRFFAAGVSDMLGLPIHATVIPLVAARKAFVPGVLAASDASSEALGAEHPDLEARFASIAPEAIVRMVAEGAALSAMAVDLPAKVVTEQLTEGAPDLEPLVIAPRFVRTPWED